MSVRARGVTVLVTMAAAAAIAVSGCSDNPAPDSLDTSDQGKSEPKDDTTPSPTPEPTDQENSGEDGDIEPTSGEVPTGPEADAAVQYVERYMKEENKAYRTGNVSKLEEMSGPNCLDCSETIGYISKTYGDGKRLEGYQLADPKVELRPLRRDGGYFVKVTGERSAWQVYDTSGNPDADDKGGSEQSNVTFVVDKVDGEWQIVGG